MMKKLFKTIAAVGTAAAAIAGGIYIFQKFFAKDEELDEVFDDEEMFDEDTEDEVEAFESEEEIFEEEPVIPVEKAAEPAPAEEEAEPTE